VAVGAGAVVPGVIVVVVSVVPVSVFVTPVVVAAAVSVDTTSRCPHATHSRRAVKAIDFMTATSA